ncbi:MAG: hypothetical protein ACQEP8_04935 [Chlamydiota bacterium]
MHEKKRSDEEFAKEIVLKYLKFERKINATAAEGDDPPDYIISFVDKEIALEITQSGEGFVQIGDKIAESCEITTAINKYLESLNSEVRSWIASGHTLILTLLSPIDDFRKFKKDLPKYLKNAFQNGEIP